LYKVEDFFKRSKEIPRLKLTARIAGPQLLVLLACAVLSTFGREGAVAQTTLQHPRSLSSKTFKLTKGMEVGLEIEARSPGASWARKGAEAAALLISVDGQYNQDLLLWAGDETFQYRVMLGNFPQGEHTISVALSQKHSAAGAQRAEVKSLRPLLFATGRATLEVAGEEQLALAHSPILYARVNTIDRFTDIPLLMYYEILREGAGDLIFRYTAIFTNEDGGTQTAALLARWGRGTDIEWVYQFRVRDQKIVEEKYQGVRHETKSFAGRRAPGSHPLIVVASDNNNFSDEGYTEIRFAPLPIHARLETATRESVMDIYPQTYRVMAEELLREGRIADTPTDINTIADPRRYLYIEAASEQEEAALGFDVKLAGESKVFSSDRGDPRLRVDRSGYFRTAVLLPKGVSNAGVESITARCHASQKPASERGCKHLRIIRALMLDQKYLPRPLPLQTQTESSLAPGETKVFRLARH
jgi:hypothetical protein